MDFPIAPTTSAVLAFVLQITKADPVLSSQARFPVRPTWRKRQP